MKKGNKELRTFEDLDCWKACRELRVFTATSCKVLPKAEEYRLKDQVVRAARRTTAGVAEGYGRFHYQEQIQYCRMSRGSAYEVLDHFITVVDEHLFSEETLAECRERVEKAVSLINGYIRYLHERPSNPESSSLRMNQSTN